MTRPSQSPHRANGYKKKHVRQLELQRAEDTFPACISHEQTQADGLQMSKLIFNQTLFQAIAPHLHLYMQEKDRAKKKKKGKYLECIHLNTLFG